MIARVLLVTALPQLQVPGPAPGAGADASESVPHRVEHVVPFLPQGELLCGGAAAAMVERYWGARGVYAEDYRALVREHEGGIRAGELAGALRGRGYRVRTMRGPAAAARLEREALAAPLIVLLGSGEARFHYVVLVALDDDRALVHDPTLGPRRSLSLDEFRRRWSASGFWALEARPPADSPRPPAPDGDGTVGPRSTALGHGRYRGTSAAFLAHPLVSEALRALRAGRHDDARRSAARLMAERPADSTLAHRLMATSSYLDGEHELALDHWNRLGEPRLDLIGIEGLRVTRYPLVWRHLGLRPGTVLTDAALRRARRRLSHIPAVTSARMGYHPLADGSAEVRAAVVERSRAPGGRSLLAAALEALVDREASLALGPLLGSGDAWTLAAAWSRADAAFGGRVAALVPPVPGVVHVASGWRRQRFRTGDGGQYDEVRVRVAAGVRHWWTDAWRVGGELGLERWGNGPRVAVLGASALRRFDRVEAWAATLAQTWIGAGPVFGRVRLEAEAELPHAAGRSWRLALRAALTTSSAPRSLWNGAGTGRVREPLLRGHTLVSDGAIAGPAFGRGLAVASVQHVWWRGVGPARAGIVVFADAALSWHRPMGAGARAFLDPGVGALWETERWRTDVSLAVGGRTPVLSARVRARVPVA